MTKGGRADMRRSALRLYAPFIALALAQAAFVVFAPSKGESSNPLASVQAGQLQTGGGAGGGGATSGFSSNGGGTTTGTGTGATAAGTGATSSGGGGSAVAAGTTGGGGGGETGVAAAGDTSHCKGGQQTDVIYNAPPCAAKFTG